MRKNGKRILALWLALIFAAIGLAGCASDPAETTDSSTTETTVTETTTTETTTETTATATATEVSETTSATETKATESTAPRMTEMTPPTQTTATETTAKPEDQPSVHILRLVYLGTDANTLFEADLTGTSFLVKTDRPACAMDGTTFGPIFYRYDTTSATYLKKLTENTLYSEIAPGRFYLTEEDGEIVRELPSLVGFSTVTKKNVYADSFTYDYSYDLPVFTGKDLADGTIFRSATITSVSGGKIMAKLGTDDKETDITDWNVKFIYADVEGKTLRLAGNNAQVSVSSFDTMVAALETLYDNAAKAKIMYETYRDGRVVDGQPVTYSADTVAYYENLWKNAEAELEAGRENALNQRMNGAFWGKNNVEASPLAAYFSKVKLSFGKDASLSFVYFTVDDVRYILATTFDLK